MLPNISKRKLLSGMDRNNYDDAMLRKILRERPSDGHTNSKCFEVVGRLNDYLSDSLSLLLQFTVVREILDDIVLRKHVNEKLKPIMEVYFANADTLAAYQCKRNAWTIISSLSEQRKFFKSVKKIMKNNVITNDWLALMNYSVDRLYDRLNRLTSTTLKYVMEPTPMYIYYKVMEESGRSVTEDIFSFIGNDVSIFDDLVCNEKIEELKEHIEDIIAENITEEEIASICETARKTADAYRRKAELIQLEKENEKKKSLERRRDELEELVLATCSNTEKLLRTHCKKKMVRYGSRYPEVFCVAAARVNLNKTIRVGFFKTGNNGYVITTEASKAKIFFSEEEAKAAIAKMEQDNELITAIARVQLCNYIHEVA